MKNFVIGAIILIFVAIFVWNMVLDVEQRRRIRKPFQWILRKFRG